MNESINVAGFNIVVNEAVPEGAVYLCDSPRDEVRLEGRDLVVTRRYRVRKALNLPPLFGEEP